MPQNSPGTSVLQRKRSLRNSHTITSNGAANAGRTVGKIVFFDRWRVLPLRRFTSENLCPFATMVRVHDSALAEEDAMTSFLQLWRYRTLVVVALWWSQLRSSWYQQDWSYSLLNLMSPTAYSCMWHGASHACCAVVHRCHLSRTMRVQNYADRKRNRIYIAPFIYYVYLKALRHGSHSFTCKYTMPAFPSYAFTRWRHL